MIAGNLFTRDYLLEGIALSEPWKALTDAKVSTLKASFLRCVQSLQAISKANEAQTEKTLIYPLLELLGWTDVEVQQTLSSRGRKQVPDALRGSLPLDAIRRPRDTPIWKLEAALKCRSCKKGRCAPPVQMIKLTETREITPYLWVHPHEDR